MMRSVNFSTQPFEFARYFRLEFPHFFPRERANILICPVFAGNGHQCEVHAVPLQNTGTITVPPPVSVPL